MISLYIQSLTTEKVGIVEEENQIKELIIDRPGLPNQVGYIYLAKVVKVEKGLQAAFVDIGDEKLGFLQRKELPSARVNKDTPIESLITEGQRIIVQIQKDAYGDKGARLTTNITIPGIDIVYLPYGNYVAASRKLADDTRNELRQLVDKIKINEEGAIVRTSAKGRSQQEIEHEFKQLRRRWRLIEDRSKKNEVPSCLFKDDAVTERLVRKFQPESISAIYVDNSIVSKHIKNTYPAIQDKVIWKKDLESNLPKTIGQIMEDAIDPIVRTSSGVELCIEHTEAMTVIDVNTATYTGKTNKEQTIVNANVHAAVEVARQVRLRNISGIVIVDFIGMNSVSQQKQVIQALQKELANDSVRTEVYGFTKLGLLEMTRKRESLTLPYLLSGNHSKKQDFSLSTSAFLLERELLGFQSNQAEALIIEINPSIYTTFFDIIDIGQLKENVVQDVYFIKTKAIHSYQIKLSGSTQLITDYLSAISNDSIDKVL